MFGLSSGARSTHGTVGDEMALETAGLGEGDAVGLGNVVLVELGGAVAVEAADGVAVDAVAVVAVGAAPDVAVGASEDVSSVPQAISTLDSASSTVMATK